MRAFVSLLVCLALAFQGVALARIVDPPCPMQQPTHEVAFDASTQAQQDDSCNDAETTAKTGKACKTGAQCQSTSVCLPLASPSGPMLRASAPQPRIEDGLAPADSTHSVWRPPALI